MSINREIIALFTPTIAIHGTHPSLEANGMKRARNLAACYNMALSSNKQGLPSSVDVSVCRANSNPANLGSINMDKYSRAPTKIKSNMRGAGDASSSPPGGRSKWVGRRAEGREILADGG